MLKRLRRAIGRAAEKVRQTKRETRRELFMPAISKEVIAQYAKLEGNADRASAIQRKIIAANFFLAKRKEPVPPQTIEQIATTIIDIEERKKQFDQRKEDSNKDPHLKNLMQTLAFTIGDRKRAINLMGLIKEMESAIVAKTREISKK
jgi:hypothetical protein